MFLLFNPQSSLVYLRQASGTNSNANSISSNKDAAKKSRFGNSSVFGGLSGNTAAVKKTSESTKKIPSKWTVTLDGQCWMRGLI